MKLLLLKIKSKFATAVLLFLLIAPHFSSAQTIITIGTGTGTNTQYDFPAPYGNWYWGAKHHFMIRATELSAQGMIAGNISSLAFNVATVAGTPLTNFSIRIKLAAANALTNTFNNAGFTTVYGPQTYTETLGWNTHTFISPFYWDGTSNIVIQTCFNNNSYTSNAQVYNSTTGFNSSLYYFQDGTGVCTSTSGTTSAIRPDIRFTYTPPNVAPVADFSTNTTNTCSGQISFFDLSGFNPTSWLWNFGDGNTSTLQNPTHTYLSSGSFTVSLTATNAYGSDIKTVVNYITVNLSGGTPIAASCTPNTLNGSFGFGITNFTFNTINNTSGNASTGYSDFTCFSTNVYAAQNYAISAVTNTPAEHNVRAWIDFNNDGVFNNITELVFSADNVFTSSGSVNIPTSAVLNTPVRLRISADYNLSAVPTPCSDLDYGQAEDYTVIILPNTFPPVADFTVDDAQTCDGTVSFTDISTNIPTSWYWTFGDGNFSNQQHPAYTYTSSGTYTVTLIAYNANGSDTIVYTNLINVNLAGQVTPASCSPTTLSYCCGYGIFEVIFNTINNPSGNGSESYRDFSCSFATTVTEGNSYPVSIKTGTTNPQDTRIWIDFNNDGIFTSTELVFQGLNAIDPNGNISIPGGQVLNTALRMRVSSDYVGSGSTPCSNPTYGQVEDYAVIIQPVTFSPVADFSADKTFTCDGIINFTDLSTNAPTSWLWDFGDLNSSILQNPQHTYLINGTYTVTLTATNSFGSDIETKTSYITVNSAGCDTVLMPFSGNGPIETACSGVIMDDGGNNDYSDNSYGIVTIAPTGASSIMLNFLTFDFESGFDYLTIYDGPNTGSPVIGYYDGNVLPNGGVIISSGNAITLEQYTDGSVTMPGFLAEWSCSVNLTESSNEDFLSIFPNPARDIITITYNSNNHDKNNMISIKNILGETVFDQYLMESSGFSKTIDVSGFSRGIYFVSYISEKRQVTRKVVIQ